MLRRCRGSDLQRRSPATDNLQIGGHDAVQVSGVTLPNKTILIIYLRRILDHLYVERVLNELCLHGAQIKGFLHLLPADGGDWDRGHRRHGALYGDRDVPRYFVWQGEMPLSRGWGDYTARNRSLQDRLKEREKT